MKDAKRVTKKVVRPELMRELLRDTSFVVKVSELTRKTPYATIGLLNRNEATKLRTPAFIDLLKEATGKTEDEIFVTPINEMV